MESSSGLNLRLPRSDVAASWLGKWQRENPGVTMKWTVLGSGITAMFTSKGDCKQCGDDAKRSKLV